MADTLRSWTCTTFYEMKTWQFAQDQVPMDGDYKFSERLLGKRKVLYTHRMRAEGLTCII